MDLEQLKQASCRTALKKMQEGGTFYCTTVEEIARTLGVMIPTEARNIFHNYHCVKFSDLSQDEFHALLQLMAEVFDQEPIDMPDIIFRQRDKSLNLISEVKEPNKKEPRWMLEWKRNKSR